MLTQKQITKIREIYKTKGNLNDFPHIKKILFQQYYPQLAFKDFKHSTIWFFCVWSDYCGDLFGNTKTEDCTGDEIVFSDSPGPVG